MIFVLDVSMAGPWVLADEPSEAAARVAQFLVEGQALVPPIWWYEVRNLLVVAERRGRLGPDASAAFLALLGGYSIEIELAIEHEETVHLARQYRISVYDAAYLELALRKQIPLATLDRALASAARSSGVAILE